jgi:hypothetical protein
MIEDVEANSPIYNTNICAVLLGVIDQWARALVGPVRQLVRFRMNPESAKVAAVALLK